jgi:hypothetical protein
MPCSQPFQVSGSPPRSIGIDPKPGQHQRHPKQCQQRDSQTAHPPRRQFLAHGGGEDDDQQARCDEARNLSPIA